MDASQSPSFVTVYLTAENEDMAKHIAIALIKDRLVACANVIGGMRSIYEYEGTLQLETEVLVIMKSRADKIDAIKELVTDLHSYEVPCLTVLPIIDGLDPYLTWVNHQMDLPRHDTGAVEDI